MSVKNLIPREHYMSKIRQSRGTPFIKILTGIRRCGKSSLMEMFIDELRESGVPDDRIFYSNLDDEGCGIETFRDLIDSVSSKISDTKGAYLFFDEIQNVPEWERAVSTFYIRDADVYVTGSNSNMFSTELSTKLSGRCLEIFIQPLVFSEYLNFRNSDDTDKLLEDYIRYGGFPAVSLMMDVMPGQVKDILDGIYNTVFNKDVMSRHEIRGNAMISNLSIYLMKNIGDRTSVRGVSNYLTSKGIRTQPQTVNQYIGFLEEALLFSKANRLDLKTKEYLRTTDKFYVSDMGIRHSQITFHPKDLDGIVENIVYNELLYRFGDVSVCSVDLYEVDFIADPMGMPSYYQVSLNVTDLVTLERELRPLRKIADNYPKTIITYDRFPMNDIDGIRIVSLKDWLLNK